MIIFEDIGRRRFISRLDPRVRFVCVLLFAVVICLCERPSVLFAGLAAAAALLSMSGMSLRQAGRRLLTINGFMLLVAATMPAMMPGQPAFQVGRIAWSFDGLFRALLIAVRANAVMVMVTALLGTLEVTHLGFALGGLGVPDKFTHLLLFMVRYTEIIHHEYHHLRDAMLLRAFRPRFDKHTFRSLGFLVGQLLVRSVNRADRVMEAMKCRGFQGRFYVLAPCHIECADIAFAMLSIVGVLALSFWEWL